MSSMLEQAILDAKELKEAAIKNAQQALVEKYSGEFEGEVEKLLEQAAVPTPPIPAAPMPVAPMPGTTPVDPEKAKADSDAKSNIFDKLEYAYADGEVIGDKVYKTGVVEIDLDSISQYSFEKNQKTPEQMALQELKQLSKNSLLEEELEEEMNNDDDFDDDSDSFPYDDGEEDMDGLEIDDEDEEFEDEDSDDEDSDDEDSDDDETEEDIGFEDDDEDEEFDIEDEDPDDDEDLYISDEGPKRFEIDFETDEDFDDEDSDDEDSDDEEADEDSDDESEEEEFDIEDEDELETIEESDKQSSSVEMILQKIENLESSMKKKNIKDSQIEARLTDIISAVKKLDSSEKKQLKEAIKLDYRRSGPRSPWNGMFKEEAEHDVMLAELQAQIEELEQKVEELQESNKKLKNGLKDSLKLSESLNDKVAKYEEKLFESRFLNYKLLYTNKALIDASLNERQKNKIAESISNAKTAEEVKLLYETLKSTMRDGTSNSSPKSLSEAVERRSSSLLLKSSRVEPPKQNDYAERMKKLAGLT